MKKFPSILFVFSLLFMLTACSSSADPSQESSGQTTSPSSQQDSVSVSNAVLESESTESEQSANNTLIVYFSRWGNTEYPSDVDAITSASIVVDNNSRYGTTEYVANMIAENVGGDLHRIETVTPYTADFDELRDVNHDEMSRNYLPELKESNLDISAYDTVFIGYPVWATDVPQAVLSFLKEYDLSGKTVIPFCTHDGYGAGNSYQTIAEASHAAVLLEGIAIEAEDVPNAQDTVSSWLADIGISKSNDRTQYRQKNHHEAIVSREVFNAANHLRASRNYSKKNRPLPVLSVVEDGILRGYVPFDKDWTGFSAEEYREASESVMKEPDVTVTADVKKRLDLTGYEIVRVQYFSTMQNPAMTISNGRLRFNTACLKKFENVEYVELLLNSVERCIAIRPCDKNNPNAIRWGRLKEGRWCASTLGCRGLAKTLFDIMEWDEDLRYRFRGQFLEQGDNKMMLFAFDEPEMIKVEEIVLPPKENTEEDEGETVKKKIYIFPPEWAGTFGQPITSIAQVGILRQEHYAGNWDVFRPATEIEEMNIFTAESLNELLREAEKIMEGWTDYR